MKYTTRIRIQKQLIGKMWLFLFALPVGFMFTGLFVGILIGNDSVIDWFMSIGMGIGAIDVLLVLWATFTLDWDTYVEIYSEEDSD